MAIFIPRPESDLGNLPEIKQGKLNSGERGNFETLSLIKKSALSSYGNPKIRRFVENILNYYQIKSHNHYDKAVAIGKYVQESIQYMKDPIDIEMLTDPLTMLNRIQLGKARGDCDDFALFISTLLLACGIRPFLKIVKFKKNSRSYNHIYVVCYVSNYKKKPKRLVIDGIIKDKKIGYEVKSVIGKEIVVQ